MKAAEFAVVLGILIPIKDCSELEESLFLSTLLTTAELKGTSGIEMGASYIN